MSGDTQPQPEAGTAPTVEEMSAAFSAGFDEDDDQPRTPTETPAPEPEATPEPAEAAPEYVQITKQDWESLNTRAAKVDEISATLDKRFDQVLGTMGRTLERKLAEKQAAAAPGETAALDEDDFAELREQYPEVAELQMKGMSKLMARFKGASNPGDIKQIVSESVEGEASKLRKEIVNASLDAVFPGWDADVKTPQFAEWLKGQSAEINGLAQSSGIGDAARMLRLFYAAKDAPAPKPAPPQASTRQRQLAAAVSPKSDGGTPPSSRGKSPFQAGFEEDD